MSRPSLALILPLVAALTVTRVEAQAPPPAEGPAIGTVAPDFALPGATRYGVLRTPIHLSDFKGKTVVLAFFYKARTKG